MVYNIVTFVTSKLLHLVCDSEHETKSRVTKQSYSYHVAKARFEDGEGGEEETLCS